MCDHRVVIYKGTQMKVAKKYALSVKCSTLFYKYFLYRAVYYIYYNNSSILLQIISLASGAYFLSFKDV